MLNGDEIVQYIRLNRWLPSKFGFKVKNILNKVFWAERGWGDKEIKIKISKIQHDRSANAVHTKTKIKNQIIFNGDLVDIEYKGIKFKSNSHPNCKLCSSQLILTKKDYKISNFDYKIIGCSNEKCTTHKMGKLDKCRIFLPEYVVNELLSNRTKNIKKSNKLCVDYWLNNGDSIENAKIKISKIQSQNSKLVKNRFIVSKRNLKKRGFTDEEISNITLTPLNSKFWINKGLSDEEAAMEIKLIQQNNALKFTQKKKSNPELYSAYTTSQLAYWLNKGYSEDNAKQLLSERQKTFTLEKCIQKYGEVEGKQRFTDRQTKWSNSLINNGNLKIGYSKISQELFYKLLDSYDINERNDVFFATHNKEYRLNKKEGGVWLYDFTDAKRKKIIEYHGDMYHGNPEKYVAEDNPHPFTKKITAQEMWDKDKRKLDVANGEGFEVLVIWDSEYRWGNKENVINKCLDFLHN